MKKFTKDFFETNAAKENTSQEVRINKFLADAGSLSRREADKAVEAGRVTIDGEVAVMGSKVAPGSVVTLDGKPVTKENELVLIAFNKPVGIVCTTDRRDPDNIVDFINYSKRIYPIGRLDKDSEGLLFLTNDGDIVNKILRAGNFHEKEYVVTVNKPITAEFIQHMSEGVEILDTVTRPCKVEMIDKMTFRIILTQGLNRQIRRMCEALDYRVRHLTRVRIMNVELGRLKSGTYRNLTEDELSGLEVLIRNSSNTHQPVAPDKLHRRSAFPKKDYREKKPEGVGAEGDNRGKRERYRDGAKTKNDRYSREGQSKNKGADRASRQGGKSVRAREH